MLKYIHNIARRQLRRNDYYRCFSVNSTNTNDDGFYNVSSTSQVASLNKNEIYGEIIDYAIGNH